MTKGLGRLCWIMMLGLSLTTHAQSIEVFTIADMPVSTDHEAWVCLLDKQHVLEKELSALEPGLSRKALERHATHMNPAFEQAFHCALKATHYKLTHLPAIVIDKRWVLYGIDSVDEALIYCQKAQAGVQ